MEIKQPVLATFSNDYAFFVEPEGKAVVFRANCGGVTTKGSSYPRSELRERSNGGTVDAAWSSSVGYHVMKWTGCVKKIPTVKRQTVIGQIRKAN
jgi:Alginate lyase